MRKYNALIFGGSGFLGVHLCNYLLDKKFKICVFDIKRNPNLNKKIKFIKGNIKNKNQVKKFLITLILFLILLVFQI